MNRHAHEGAKSPSPHGGEGISGLRSPCLTLRTPMRSIGYGEGATGLSIGPTPLTPTLSPAGRGSAHAQAGWIVAFAVSTCMYGAASAQSPPPAQPTARVTVGFVEI